MSTSCLVTPFAQSLVIFFVILFYSSMLFGKSSLRAVCLTFVLRSAVAVDHTWWIDQSCNGKLDNAVPEAFETAKIIRERLPADPNAAPGSPAASAFQALFSRDAFWYLSTSYTEQLDRELISILTLIPRMCFQSSL